MAVLGILSGSRSSRDMGAVAKRQRQEFNQALGKEFKLWPSDATFLYFYRSAEAWRLQQGIFAGVGAGVSGLDDQSDPMRGRGF